MQKSGGIGYISKTGKAKPNLHDALYCSTRHPPPIGKAFKVAILQWRRETTNMNSLLNANTVAACK
jgi:hypothetical protein